MCTAISYHADSHYFGRNLDLEYSYGEKIVITPRCYPLQFRKMPSVEKHFAMIGMAIIADAYPLYYDATNEKGLSMSGLNFPGNAHYNPVISGLNNISPFELIPWILCQCQSVKEARHLLDKLNLVDLPFNNDLPLTPLHWLLADQDASIVVEPLNDGLHVYENPVGVLTNSPSFPYHIQNLCNYKNLGTGDAGNNFSDQIQLSSYSRGMGAIGLPGDLSSSSRFIRATFTKLNSVSDETKNGSISQFFHILDSVSMVQGCVKVQERFEKTQYTSCCDTNAGVYYYTTYGNRQITGISLTNCDLDSTALQSFPLQRTEQIRMEN